MECKVAKKGRDVVWEKIDVCGEEETVPYLTKVLGWEELGWRWVSA